MQTIDQETGMVVSDDHKLVPLRDVEAFLATRPPIDTAKELRDRLAALCAYYQGHVQVFNEVFEGQLRTERYIGALLAEMPKANGRRTDLEPSNTVLLGSAPTLDDLGFTKMQSSRLQQFAAVPEERFEQYIAERKDAAERIAKADILDLAPQKEGHQLINQSLSNEWYTPAEYVNAARELMGGIDTDPASNDQANTWIKADTYHTKDHDGFDEPWHGRVWMNPPYGKQDSISNQQRWTARLIENYQEGITTEAVCLVNAVPGNIWFAPLWAFPICFVARRIIFYDINGVLGQPTHSNVLVYLPDRDRHASQVARFVHVFSSFGPVAARLIECGGKISIHGIGATA